MIDPRYIDIEPLSINEWYQTRHFSTSEYLQGSIEILSPKEKKKRYAEYLAFQNSHEVAVARFELRTLNASLAKSIESSNEPFLTGGNASSDYDMWYAPNECCHNCNGLSYRHKVYDICRTCGN